MRLLILAVSILGDTFEAHWTSMYEARENEMMNEDINSSNRVKLISQSEIHSFA